MYCVHCGKPIDDKAVVCVHCGLLTEAGKSKFTPPPVKALAPAAAPEQAESASPKRKNPFAIAGFTVAIVSAVFGAIFYSLLTLSAISSGMETALVVFFILCLFGAVSGLIFSSIGLAMRRRYRLNGLAIAGIVMSVIHLVLFFLFFVLGYFMIFGTMFYFMLLLLIFSGAGVV